MTDDGTPAETRVELYARDSLPAPAQRRCDEVIDRLAALADDGHVEAVDIDTWDKRVRQDGDTPERRLYARYRDWAAEAGVDLAPFFDTRTCYSMRDGSRGEWLVLPALCIAIYRDDELQTVYPHSTGNGSRSVMDCLRALESGRDRIEGVTDHRRGGEHDVVPAPQ